MIIHGDCLEVMPTLDKVDLIIADPPYNIKKDFWDYRKDYNEFMQKVFLECEKGLKDNGSFYWFHNSMPSIARFMVCLEETSFVFKNLVTIRKKDNDYIKALYGSQEHFRK